MKKMKYLFIIILIIAICIPIISKAFDISNISNGEDEKFFQIEKTEALPGETIEMDINIDKIMYENFKFLLNSNSSLETITTQEEIQSEVENNQLEIEANKSSVNISKITLFYEIPQDAQIGEIIELIATIENNDEEIENEDIDQKQQITYYITIIDKQEETENNGETDTNGKGDEFKKQQINENIELKLESSENKNNERESQTFENMIQNVSQKIENSITQIQGTNTNQESENIQAYKGESNNYLTSLSVNNYELNTEFSKTNTNYFITVNNDTTNIEINALPEDENAKVTIYGNDNLEEGKNKVLISVTAENGEVKIYRIYVEKSA